MSTRRQILGAFLLGAAVLAACSGGDDGDGAVLGGTGTAGTPAASMSTGTMIPAPSGTIPPSTTPGVAGADPMWAWNGSEWGNLGGPAPECPATLPSAIDLTLATSVLYPGQVRGDYKAHGGFRFDGLAPNDIEVRSPIDGVIVRAAHYLASGELQYTLDLIHPCGLMVRLGHLRELTPELTAIFENFAPPVELDSRSTFLNPAVPVAAGDLVATSVGLYTTNNTFLDIGMYDLRQRNESAQDPTWLAQHNNDTHAYGLCWFGLLGPDAEATILALPPADGVMGATSDYCQ